MGLQWDGTSMGWTVVSPWGREKGGHDQTWVRRVASGQERRRGGEAARRRCCDAAMLRTAWVEQVERDGHHPHCNRERPTRVSGRSLSLPLPLSRSPPPSRSLLSPICHRHVCPAGPMNMCRHDRPERVTRALINIFCMEG
jgi:hypothetical protein